MFSGQAPSRKRGRAAEFKISVEDSHDEENDSRHSLITDHGNIYSDQTSLALSKSGMLFIQSP